MQQLVKVWINRLNSWSSFRGSSIGVVSFVGCLALLMVLGWLCQEVWEREAFSFDTNILLWIHQSATPILDSIMLNITGLADPPMVAAIFFGTTFWLWRRRKYSQIKVFAIACIGGLALNIGLKIFFAKPRPQLWHQLIVETSSSFPSGHALGSMVVYGFLAYLLATEFPRSSRLIYAVMTGLILLIGLSRLYLGVHWLTDVIAGYLVGFLWVITCISILKCNLSSHDEN